MAAKKAPPKPTVRNKAVTGKPLTPSGSGTVHPGRTGPRNEDGRNGNASKELQARNSRTAPRDWKSVTSSLSQRDRQRMSTAMHKMAEQLYRPVGSDADRPTGRRSPLPDQRLYAKELMPKPKTAKSTTTTTAKTKRSK